MFIAIYKKIPQSESNMHFSMPHSLRLIKEFASHNIDYLTLTKLHWYDIMSLIYAFRIDDAKNYLRQKGKSNYKKAGIDNVTDVSGTDILKYMC